MTDRPYQDDVESETDAPRVSEPVSLRERMPAVLDEIEAIGARGGGQLIGVPTGFQDIDLLTGGFHPGLVHTIFGTTGIGSSMLALGFARQAAIKHGLATLVFSGQTPINELTIRMLSAESGVPTVAIRIGAMRDEDWTRLARRMEQVADAPLFMHDDPNLSWKDLVAHCRRLRRENDLRLVVIDGVNLYARPTAPESLWAAQVRVATDIKRLAAELRVPFVVTVPVNRRADNRDDRRPELADIASSSAYAAEADVVIGLHREDAYDTNSPRAGEADLIVMKNRYGPVATAVVAFQGHYSRFVDIAPPDSAPARLEPLPDEPS